MLCILLYIHNYSSQFRNLTAENTQTVGLTLRPAVGAAGSFGLDWFGGFEWAAKVPKPYRFKARGPVEGQ